MFKWGQLRNVFAVKRGVEVILGVQEHLAW